MGLHKSPPPWPRSTRETTHGEAAPTGNAVGKRFQHMESLGLTIHRGTERTSMLCKNAPCCRGRANRRAPKCSSRSASLRRCRECAEIRSITFAIASRRPVTGAARTRASVPKCERRPRGYEAPSQGKCGEIPDCVGLPFASVAPGRGPARLRQDRQPRCAKRGIWKYSVMKKKSA